MTEQNELKEPSTHHHHPVTGIWWWAMLVVAVLAVPSFGFAVALTIPSSGYGTLAVFVLACWLCTYLGIYLMKEHCGK